MYSGWSFVLSTYNHFVGTNFYKDYLVSFSFYNTSTITLSRHAPLGELEKANSLTYKYELSRGYSHVDSNSITKLKFIFVGIMKWNKIYDVLLYNSREWKERVAAKIITIDEIMWLPHITIQAKVKRLSFFPIINFHANLSGFGDA